MTACSLVGGYRQLGGECCFFFRAENVDPEERGIMFLRNFDIHLQGYEAVQHKRPQSDALHTHNVRQESECSASIPSLDILSSSV